MPPLRVIGMPFLFIGLVLLGHDILRGFAGGMLRPQTLEDVWRAVVPGGPPVIEGFLLAHLGFWVTGLFVLLLQLWAFFVFLLIGGALSWLGRVKDGTIFFRPWRPR